VRIVACRSLTRCGSTSARRSIASVAPIDLPP
jgi:hypothetical protein